MPREEHLRGISSKERRQYEHIKESAEREGRYGKRAKEVAARTVMNPCLQPAPDPAPKSACSSLERTNSPPDNRRIRCGRPEVHYAVEAAARAEQSVFRSQYCLGGRSGCYRGPRGMLAV
jgi:hypothetical protein